MRARVFACVCMYVHILFFLPSPYWSIGGFRVEYPRWAPIKKLSLNACVEIRFRLCWGYLTVVLLKCETRPCVAANTD